MQPHLLKAMGEIEEWKDVRPFLNGFYVKDGQNLKKGPISTKLIDQFYAM